MAIKYPAYPSWYFTERQHRSASDVVPLGQFAEFLTTLDTPSPDPAPGCPAG
ncbi:MAG: hypothetical protein OXG47_05995 [bacterium]|nr:hypothetical protein [bacterium]